MNRVGKEGEWREGGRRELAFFPDRFPVLVPHSLLSLAQVVCVFTNSEAGKVGKATKGSSTSLPP